MFVCVRVQLEESQRPKPLKKTLFSSVRKHSDPEHNTQLQPQSQRTKRTVHRGCHTGTTAAALIVQPGNPQKTQETQASSCFDLTPCCVSDDAVRSESSSTSDSTGHEHGNNTLHNRSKPCLNRV